MVGKFGKNCLSLFLFTWAELQTKFYQSNGMFGRTGCWGRGRLVVVGR